MTTTLPAGTVVRHRITGRKGIVQAARPLNITTVLVRYDGEWVAVTDAPPIAKRTCCSFPQSDELGGCSTCGAYWGDR